MNGAAEETDLIGLEGQDGEKRISYFDTLGGDLSKKTFTYVCIIAGQFSKDADRTEYSELAYYQKFFKRHQLENEKITGILLAFKTSFIHVLEAPQKIMYPFLNDVNSGAPFLHDGAGPSMTEQIRVLMLSDDLSAMLPTQSTGGNTSTTGSSMQRNFPFWASKIIDTKEEGSSLDWNNMDEQGVDDQVANVCVNLLSIGHSLSGMTKVEMKVAFEDIVDKFRGQMPTQTLANELATQSRILPISDWCKEFQGHMTVKLESELVWPAPNPILIT